MNKIKLSTKQSFKIIVAGGTCTVNVKEVLLFFGSSVEVSKALYFTDTARVQT